MNFLQFNQFMFFLVAGIGLWLAFWVYLAGRGKKINKYFFLMVLLWVFGAMTPYFVFRNVLLPQEILFFLPKLEVASVFIFFIFFYFFSINFLEESKKSPLLNKLILLTAVIGASLALFTNLFQERVEITQAGKGLDLILTLEGKIAWLGFVAIITLFIFFRFLINYFRAKPKRKLRLQYFLIGITSLIVVNLIFSVYFPLFRNTFLYAYIGIYSIIVLFSLTAFAIVKQELFGIRVILTQVLVAVIAILLFAQAVTSESWFEFAWKFVLFLIFIYFGYLLVQSVIREIQRRAELQRLYDELEKLDEAKTEFMSIVSHQLRTPLTAIKGYTSMLLEEIYGKFPEKMKKPLNNTLASSERLIKFVNDILNVTRIETGRIEFTPEKTSLEEIISSVIFELEIKAKEKNLYLKWEKPKETLPKILIDPDKIRQVIMNLIDNAIKYTNEGGITAEVGKMNSTVRIKVSDTGTGMSKEDIAKLFKSFSRGESGVAYYKEGTGLGLYIGRKFVEMQGGKVWAESPGKGKGSTFYIELPIK